MLRYNAGLADKIYGYMVSVDEKHFPYTRYEPVKAWDKTLPCNFSMFLSCLKQSAAVAAGCATVMKTPEQALLIPLNLTSSTKEACFPSGIVIITLCGVLTSIGESHHINAEVSLIGTCIGRQLNLPAGVPVV